MNPRILIVDDDRTTRRLVRKMIPSGTGEVHEAGSGAEALQTLANTPGPWIVLLDIVIPEPDGRAVCRIVRERQASPPEYIILMSARSSRAEVAAGLDAGADDFLSKPIAPDRLQSKLGVAHRHIGVRRQASDDVLAGLEEGELSGSGELIVREGDTVGRVLFHEHRIAWAHISDETGSLADVLSRDGLEHDELVAAVDEARRTGESFHRVLLTWGLLDEDRLHQALLEWIRRRVHALLHWPAPRVLFVPARRGGRAEMSFSVADVLPAASSKSRVRRRRGSPPPVPTGKSAEWRSAFVTPEDTSEDARAFLEAAMSIDHTKSAALVDPTTGVCLGWAGIAPDPAVVWAQIEALSALTRAGEKVGDFMIATDDSFHLLKPIRTRPSQLCYLVLERCGASLGHARAALAQIEDSETAPLARQAEG